MGKYVVAGSHLISYLIGSSCSIEMCNKFFLLFFRVSIFHTFSLALDIFNTFSSIEIKSRHKRFQLFDWFVSSILTLLLIKVLLTTSISVAQYYFNTLIFLTFIL